VSHHHEAYGISIRSDRPLDGLRSAAPGAPDLQVDFDEHGVPGADAGAAQTTSTTGFGSMRACDGGGRLLRYASHGGARVWDMRVGAGGRSISVRWSGPVDLGDVAAYVEATGLPLALSLRGVPLLHGCAVDLGDAAFVVLGAGGAGKSTIAAAAVAGGRALLTDDIAAVDDALRVHPAGIRLRMNEDTASALGWDPAGLPRMFRTPGLPGKRYARLSAGEGSLCPVPRRVAAVFVLGERAAVPAIERLPPAASLPGILTNTFLDSARDGRMRAGLLPFWARLVREVPVHAVRAPDDLRAVPAFVDELAAVAARSA
jgi:hypothetical protein